jgi:8-oxo-dGTP pyrophosphatase MutT (NUDIX family)
MMIDDDVTFFFFVTLLPPFTTTMARGWSASTYVIIWPRALVSLGIAMFLCRFTTRAFTPSTLRLARQNRPTTVCFLSTPSSSSDSESSSPSSSSSACPLPFDTLPYRGAEVRLDQQDNKGLPSCNEQFLEDLQTSLEFWKRNDYTSAWLHIPTSRASLIEHLQPQPQNNDNDDNGDLAFDLHHVNATENTIVLKRWLRPDREDKIPPFATHQVGCAGFVLSDQNELLLVKEWSGPPSNRTPTKQWKLPGGLLDAGETFGEASCREVYEETGVECDFESILAFWHRHGLMFGKSDFYYVCLLRPKTKDIRIDPIEVSDAVWMPMEEFLETQNHPLIHHVLKNVYHLDKDRPPQHHQQLTEGQTNRRLEPVIEMLEGHVRFGPDRPPFLTYTGRKERDGGAK